MTPSRRNVASRSSPYQRTNPHEAKPETKDLPYMSKEELTDFIMSTDINLSEQEIEYLHMRRRRMSLMKNKSGQGNIKFKSDPLMKELGCENPYPFKIMVLGDETFSGKMDIFQLFTLTDLIQKNPNLLDMQELPPCEIQMKVLDVKSDNLKKKYSLELWLPECSEEYTSLRPLYYPGTELFVLVFSIKEIETFNYVQKMLLPEIQKHMEDSALKEVPILLVGNHAEVRSDENYEGALVPSQDAVSLAQQNGISKYIEIFSDNLYHIHEIFQQAVIAIDLSRETNTKVTLRERADIYARESQYFRSMLTLPAPNCNFSQLDRTFELATQPGVEYFFTLDGSEPTKASHRYKAPITLKKPYPKQIKAVAFSRCNYSSPVSTFKVPEESEHPFGYFDPVTKGFHIQRKNDTVYFVTLDGTEPTTESLVYKPPGIYFDNMKVSCAFEGHPSVPDVVKVIAIEEGKFRSRVAVFHPFRVLPTPNATLKDNVLKIDTIPGVEYRYTLDGTTPSYSSTIYSHSEGVLISSDTDLDMVKVAAFPKIFFPSAVKELVNVRTKSPKKTRQIRMNRATVKRNESLSSPTHQQSNQQNSSAHYSSQTISSFNRRSKSRVNTNAAASPPVRLQRPIKAPITHKEQASSISRKVLSHQSNHSPHKSQSFKVNTTFSTSNDPTNLVTCNAEGTNVEFLFEKPVLLNNIIVKTPGQGKGPIGYTCFSVDDINGNIGQVGQGVLEDSYGEQNLDIDQQGKPCKKLLCTFELEKGKTSFKLLDMKLTLKTH